MVASAQNRNQNHDSPGGFAYGRICAVARLVADIDDPASASAQQRKTRFMAAVRDAGLRAELERKRRSSHWHDQGRWGAEWGGRSGWPEQGAWSAWGAELGWGSSWSEQFAGKGSSSSSRDWRGPTESGWTNAGR